MASFRFGETSIWTNKNNHFARMFIKNHNNFEGGKKFVVFTFIEQQTAYTYI